MFTMHPTLLVGPADWDPSRLPKQEFLDRIAAFWRDCHPSVAGAVVYGDPRSHAELAYLMHFTPKLEAAIALIPRDGAPRLLVVGGANMIGAARPLTFVETVSPLRDPGPTVARWRDELARGDLVLINGAAMPLRLRLDVDQALATPPADATVVVTDAMRRKGPREIASIREACAGLDAALAAMRAAQREGRGMTDTVLAGETAAWRRGAQDVRTLFGRDGQLAPFTVLDEAPADPLQVYAAVRHGGYWADGFTVLSCAALPATHEAAAMLDKAIGLARPGAPHRDLARMLAEEIPIHRSLSATRKHAGHSIGLALREPPSLSEASDGRFAVGEVYTVRVGLHALDGRGAAIVSAMIAITQDGHEVLWRGADA
jgi:Xaa-Pro aminopeptidase